MRLSVIAAVVCLSIVGISTGQNAEAAMRRPTHIPAQRLGSALQMLAKERNVQVVYRSELVRDQRTSGAAGDLTFDEALTQLLSGTGLTYRYLDDKAITIIPVGSSTGSATTSSLTSEQAGTAESPAPHAREGGEGGGDSPGDPSNKSFWNRFRVAQVDQGASPSSAPVEKKNEQASGKKPVVLEEVIVTAQKREERLIDTPQSVSVLSSSDFARLGATKFSDFANTVPGLSYQTSGAGFTDITLRGVTAGFDISPTVGVYVDEVPYGPSTTFGFGAQVALDVGLFDLDRVEILRGPQGTLYGASTMGGLIKYVTKRPDMTSFGGDARVALSGTESGSANYDVAAVVNVPIVADKLAVRASGFESHDGGYIDDLARNEKEVNRGDIYGGRIDLLFIPTDALSVRLTGFLQDISRDGEPTADYTFAGAMPYGSLAQNRRLAEPFDERFELVSSTVAYDFGPAKAISISSYQSLHQDNIWDISVVYVPLLKAALGRSYSAVGSPDSVVMNKFTQEVRLASQRAGPLEWVIGGFYNRESGTGAESFTLFDLTGAPAPNDLFNYSGPFTYEEYAAFGDLTWHLTSRLNVTGGLRYAHDNQVFEQFASGLFISSEPIERSQEHVFTYLANARYQVSDHATAYLRYATGYRPGGPNLAANNPATGLPLGPPTFQPDQLKSYEVGYKAETEDRRFGFDLAAYDIDWSNIQITAIRNGFAFRANAPGGATIQGAELTLTGRPSSAFTMAGAFAYQHAYMKQGDADLGSTTGERLPNVPRFTASVNADYQLAEAGLRPTVGATMRYVSDRDASFDLSAGFPQYHLPSYTTLDLRAGFTLGSVTMQLYVHNLFDELGQLSDMYPQFGTRIAILEPRTIGVYAKTQF